MKEEGGREEKRKMKERREGEGGEKGTTENATQINVDVKEGASKEERRREGRGEEERKRRK